MFRQSLSRFLPFRLFLKRANGTYISLGPLGLKASGLAREEKEKIALCLIRGRNDERNGRENAKNSGTPNSRRQKTRNGGVSHRYLSFLATPSFVSRCFLSRLRYFLVALRATLFSRVPNEPRDPQSKYRRRCMSNVEEFRPN